MRSAYHVVVAVTGAPVGRQAARAYMVQAVECRRVRQARERVGFEPRPAASARVPVSGFQNDFFPNLFLGMRLDRGIGLPEAVGLLQGWIPALWMDPAVSPQAAIPRSSRGRSPLQLVLVISRPSYSRMCKKRYCKQSCTGFLHIQTDDSLETKRTIPLASAIELPIY